MLSSTVERGYMKRFRRVLNVFTLDTVPMKKLKLPDENLLFLFSIPHKKVSKKAMHTPFFLKKPSFHIGRKVGVI